ncbi:MAG: alpha-L-glutamate ligase-like protein [Oligoflexia bacterium]|nr:alpha-L-glutamate ligase-like protein [Oligoflexia bacterium]
MFATAAALKARGVLGLNQRNAQYISRYNPRRLYPLVDDKLRTKKLAAAAGIAVPELFGVIRMQAEIRDLHQLLSKYPDFVIKPAQGSGGEGVLVIAGRSNGLYRQVSGVLLNSFELEHHVSNILGGMYSLGGHPDKAMIEARVGFDPIFEPICYLGVPDIRIIVFLGVPVMSMVRLPTRMSNGKANLHQGAIGAGISIAQGRTLKAVWRNQIIADHPDTGKAVSNIQIPQWEGLLQLAARSYELTGLGYQGIDIVLDRDRGPLILELNARPGLNIQIANGCGLLPRLQLIEGSCRSLQSAAARVEFARRSFS